MELKTVLVASYHLWNWPFKTGMHYLTEYFVNKGFRVGFITIPLSLLSFASSFDRKNRLPALIKLWLKGGEQVSNGLLTWYAPFTLFHPTPKMPALLKSLNSKRALEEFLSLSLPPLARWLKKHDFDEPDLLMFESGVCMSIYRLVQAKKTIYRISDDPKDLGQPKGVVGLESEIIETADIILPVSKPIYDITLERRKSKEGLYLLRNGVDVDLFQHGASRPEEYREIPSPRAIYVGSTAGNLLDYDLLIYIAGKLPKVSFVIIGPYPKALAKESPSNIYLLGTKPHPELPSYLQYAEVGLIPLRKIGRLDSVERPLKFYQYLASGLPVVTVNYGKLEEMRNYAFLAGNYDDFARKVSEAIAMPGNRRRELKKAAEKFSWADIYEEFERILKTHGALE